MTHRGWFYPHGYKLSVSSLNSISLRYCDAVCGYDSSVFVLLLVGYGSGSGFVVVADGGHRFRVSTGDERREPLCSCKPVGCI